MDFQDIFLVLEEGHVCWQKCDKDISINQVQEIIVVVGWIQYRHLDTDALAERMHVSMQSIFITFLG